MATTTRGGLILAIAAATHAVHDGLTTVLYLIFPLLQQELHLSLFQVGLLKSGYSGALGFGQGPMALLASRTGEGRLLALGTVALAVGFMLLGWAPRYWGILPVLFCAGLGASVQHPLASSLVARAFQTGSYRLAMGTYNFSGDIGKLAIPALVGLSLGRFGWRWPLVLCGTLGLGLNGTSSLLYATVAEMAVPGQEARAFGLYYAAVMGAGALAPSLFGFLSDLTSVRSVLIVLAALLLFTIPLALRLPPTARATNRVLYSRG